MVGSLRTLRRMFKLAYRFPKRLWIFAGASILHGAFSAAFAPMTKQLINILEESSTPEWMFMFMPDLKPRKAFFLLIGLATVLLAARCITMYVRRYLQSWLSQRIVVDVQNDLARHLLKQDLSFFHQERSGELLSRMTNDLTLLGASIKLLCISLTRPITLLFFLGALFYMNWKLALIGIITAPIAGGAITVLSSKMRRAAKRAQEKRADITSAMVQFLGGIRTVKAFACESFENEQFQQENKTYFEVCMKRERARSRTRPVVEFTSALSALLVLLVAGEIFFHGSCWPMGKMELTIGDLIGFLAALGMMYQPGKELSESNNDLQEALPGAERVFQLFDMQPQIIEGDQTVTSFDKELSIENLSFSYKPDAPVLKDVNLKIRKGECVALVGPSGGGKSTLADLILRFYDPQEGRILFDGTNLKEITYESLRQQIAMVNQSPFLFNCSVRDNISYGRNDISQEKIERAARAACIHDEIIELPEGYDTVVGERGDNLSGGQRQRVAIARAILKDAPILILDEATSALDSRNEQMVQEALTHLMEDRTSLVIAHRLSTIRHADRIAVVEDGTFTAVGTHAELLQSSPTYANLVQLQSTSFDSGASN